MRREQEAQDASPRVGVRGRRPNRFSLGNFYDFCSGLENELNGSRRIFRSKSSRKAKTDYLNRLFMIGPNSKQEDLLALALDLPEGFFRKNLLTVGEWLHAAQRVWGMPVPKVPFLPKEFLRIDAANHDPFYRQVEFAEFDAFVAMAKGAGPALMVVHGPTMIGKSYLVSQWFWSRGNNHFDASVRIDCQNLSLDQIGEGIRSAFEGCESGDRQLLFLDGLRLERDGHEFRFQFPGNRDNPFADLYVLIDGIWSEVGAFPVIVGIENNTRCITRDDLVNLVRLDAILSEHHVIPLSDDYAERFLFERGVRKDSKADRVRIARHYGGIPALLDAVAKEIDGMSASERQEFVAELPSETMPSSVARPLAFLEQWLERHEEHGLAQSNSNQDMAHPKAFLRLLALMSGSVTIGELRELSMRVRIKRISGLNIDNIRLRDLPFVNEVERDTFILHPAAKQFLRDQLSASLASGEGDPFCTREELEAIHWCAAQIRQRALRNSDEAKPWRVRTVEAFVHHICEQILLIPDSDKTPRLSHKPVSKALSERNREDFARGAGLLTGRQLWQMAFGEVKRFLLDPEKAATRSYGQFEAKARILTKLLETARLRGIGVAAEPINLHLEIAICWMHSGRLELARKVLREHSSDNHVTSWHEQAHRVRIESSILLRCGELDLLEDLLSPLEADATRIVLLAKPSATSDRMQMEVRGATKILCRLADLAYCRGRISQALVFLTQVERTQALYQPDFLNGLAARTFILASIMLPRSTAELREQAQALLERNLLYIRGRKNVAEAPMTNEEISFNILSAGILRKFGHLNRASVLMAELDAERAIERQEANFHTLAEFELEKLRIEISSLQTEVSDKDSFQDKVQETNLSGRIGKLISRTKDHGHLLLQIDAMHLQCEILLGEQRFKLMEEIEELIDRTGYALRQADLEVLRRNGSATVEIGL